MGPEGPDRRPESLGPLPLRRGSVAVGEAPVRTSKEELGPAGQGARPGVTRTYILRF